MYNEILELEEYCKKIGVIVHKETFLDGYCLKFNNGGDVVQHRGSYGCNCGCVEFGYTGFKKTDFKATTLPCAKSFIYRHRTELNEATGNE